MTLHSSRSHLEDVRDVSKGVKPAALVEESVTNVAKGLGLVVEKVPDGTFVSLSERLAYVVCKDSDACERVLAVLSKYPIGQRGESYHRELGRALGYPKKDIDYFVRRFLK